MRLNSQRVVAFIFIVFLMMACSIKPKMPSKTINSVKAKPVTIKKVKSATPKLLPMKFIPIGLTVSGYDKAV